MLRKWLPWSFLLTSVTFIFLCLAMFGSGATSVIGIVIGIPLILLTYAVLFQRRRCGHGLVSQSSFGLFWPYAIKICPKCDAREW